MLRRLKQYNNQVVLHRAKPSCDGGTGSVRLVRAFADDSSNKGNTMVADQHKLVRDMYMIWRLNPDAVHESWDAYFRNLHRTRTSQAPEERELNTGELFDTSKTESSLPINSQRLTKICGPFVEKPDKNYPLRKSPSTLSVMSTTITVPVALDKTPLKQFSTTAVDATEQMIREHSAVQSVIRSYQARGHLVAQLDPLEIVQNADRTVSERMGHPPTEITRQHKLDPSHMDKVFSLPQTTWIGDGVDKLPLREILKRLEMVYCRHIGVEYMFIHNLRQLNWIRKHLEPSAARVLDPELKVRTLKRLLRAHVFEAFLAKKWTAEKRFGLEGCEVLIPALSQMIDKLTDQGMELINICMAHRGRLNVLANICRKPLEEIFTQFHTLKAADVGSGDVKYHLGTMVTRKNTLNNKMVSIAVTANSSHLESTDTIVLGKTRCEQFMRKDTTGQKVCTIMIHGDAAFCGQGIVYESFTMSYLPHYTTHGVIHIVVNNQVGFTTDPRFSRSSPYCTDVGRVVQAPILHVNADHPESVIHVSNIAANWRMKFRKDVVVDLVCYRRNGHNELDEPAFTQPLMYTKIRKHTPVYHMYAEQLIKEKVITKEELDKYAAEYDRLCEVDFAKSKDRKFLKYSDWLDSPWKGFFKNFKFTEMPKTGIDEKVCQHIGKHFSTPPKDFVVHKGLGRVFKQRQDMVTQRTTDWALGEAFAYGSLLNEGVHVRLSGEDVERGTFSHRHHILHHQTEDMRTHNMIEGMFPGRGHYTVCNSSLSEYGVLGFEVGYSLVDPHILVMWEGQFGDFCNNAQVIFDQYIANQQAKWVRQSGLVVQLPHGLDGLGPEHSSCRLERYLQQCDDDVVEPSTKFDNAFVLEQHLTINWFVANCSNPASLFHILRRQMKLPFRKPLILATPKSLLRHPKARSGFDDFLTGTEFQRVIPEKGPAASAPNGVKRLIFCCGKTYYDMMEWIEEAKMGTVFAVARTEQLSPFPYDLVRQECLKYGGAQVCWAQEEHKNQGCWAYMKDRIALASQRGCTYLGRATSASPATGNKVQHLQEIADYKKAILTI